MYFFGQRLPVRTAGVFGSFATESNGEDKHITACDALAIPSFEEMIGRASQVS